MDWLPTRSREVDGTPESTKRWLMHAGHHAGAGARSPWHGPHVGRIGPRKRFIIVGSSPKPAPVPRLITLDGSSGEGGGQILRTSLTLSLLTGQPFRLVKVRARRERPGLRPQHLTAVIAAATLCDAEVLGARVGSRDLTFRPGTFTARDLRFEIGTAGSSALVLQTLHLPLALRAERPVRLTITGGTFNTQAPSYPFLETTWRAHLAALGATVALAMPTAGFYPVGGGQLDAWIEPAQLRPLTLNERGPLLRIGGTAGVARLRGEIAVRMREAVTTQFGQLTALEGIEPKIALDEWTASSPGAAMVLSAEFEGVSIPATFVALGEKGKPAEAVAAEAAAAFLDHLHAPGGAVDPHSADQILIPLALATGRSEFTVSAVTEHLRTNAQTIQAFLDRKIRIIDSTANEPGRVIVL